MDSCESLTSIQLLHAIGRKASVRERVVCTAAVFVFRLAAIASADGEDLLLRLTTALWMASKVEEAPVSPSTLLDAVSKLGFGSASGFDAAALIATECTMLEALDFDLSTPAHPQMHVARIGHSLGAECPEACLQTAFAIANDCFRFDLVLRHPPHVLAGACVYAAAAAHQLPGREWLERLDAASVPAIEHAVAALCGAYARCAAHDASAFDACVARLPRDARRRAARRPA